MTAIPLFEGKAWDGDERVVIQWDNGDVTIELQSLEEKMWIHRAHITIPIYRLMPIVVELVRGFEVSFPERVPEGLEGWAEFLARNSVYKSLKRIQQNINNQAYNDAFNEAGYAAVVQMEALLPKYKAERRRKARQS